MKKIDINSDMGESYGNFKVGNDEIVMPFVTAINVGCGFHGGDPCTMKRTVELAAKLGVAVGAHPGFPDLMGFGRREMKLSTEDIISYTIYQAGALQAFAGAYGLKIHHVKPHGALYNMLGKDEKLAPAFVEAVGKFGPECSIYHSGSLVNSAIGIAAAQKGVRYVREFNADTDYAPDGSVVIKQVHGKVDSESSVERVVKFLQTGKVEIGAGGELQFEADSICVHGDNPSAVEVLTLLRKRLSEIGYEITAV